MGTNMYVTQSTGDKIVLRQIRQVHPDVSIPDGADLTHLGYATLELVAPPTPDEGYYVIEGAPEEYAPGQWRQTWTQVPQPIPEQVERLQARLALIQVGLWDTVVAYFADPSRTAIEMAFWDDARTWRRDDPTVMAAGANLGLTDAQIDALFKLAATL